MNPGEIQNLQDQVHSLTDYTDYVERCVADNETPLLYTDAWESVLEEKEAQ